ncbi:hypothetical protein [Lysinibacillus xylanilyticus]|uniref:Uncharacterized protein n=1 Tax=Lysinibacillus xylanilyticus TaxID=582475 RepID=A0A2M9PYV5_9BACI|nr:hypothetical protein [Lysinibacillus xylanilyticus]PJO40999.1 hypothetical protein CWD94_25300 [Lysinibacillus xylanilyticus]
MAIYEQSAIDLLEVVKNPECGDIFLFLGEQGYTFTYRREYQGLMAKINPKFKKYSKKKQGYFDILGNMNNVKLTHQQLFEMLLSETSYEECEQVWRGEMPEATGDKRHALLCLAMLMFEQEINFGNEIFQRKSHYSPDVNNPNYVRPRDLLMGYVRYMFEQGDTECLKKFQVYGLLHPPKDELIKREYFEVLENDQLASALMGRDNIVGAFKQVASQAPDNPAL